MDFNIGRSSGPRKTAKAAPRTGGALAGWLMTAVAPFGENEEHAMDQALVELGLGDARLIRGEGAMLPIGFEPGVPQDLPIIGYTSFRLVPAHHLAVPQMSSDSIWRI